MRHLFTVLSTAALSLGVTGAPPATAATPTSRPASAVTPARPFLAPSFAPAGAQPSAPGARLSMPSVRLAELTRLAELKAKRANVKAAPHAPGTESLRDAAHAHHGEAGVPKRQPVSRVLLLTIARGENATPADRVAYLQCTPKGGTHTKADEACRQLDRVSANLNDLHVSPDARCTKEYNPVTVFGAGLWGGSRLSYERTFGNPCELRAYTGAVFDF
ncbi:SSI family serine proteinase inhibitor [Sphaerisporangium sp. TRM90804]|uniref:SSI family serine proteinase inhibitor n=1 Tax=Sphaerisporangium sp. TRM90804 TaxID=3031113 RepID=UPI00244C99B5|nr:SSI family serine proteinase inhibitor [Sphaerisporangium sp. TRM90804]MDH2427763.1 SSI family serine proteinase inhibitor [Sphaerisporangium sp. TRM90804]